MTDTQHDWTTPTTTYTDERGGTRTAINLGNTDGGSIDLLDENGVRVAQLNLFLIKDTGTVIVDVIDVDHRFANKHALTDPGSGRDCARPTFDYLVSADMRERTDR